MSKNNIVLIDPATDTNNIGDLIIKESVVNILNELFSSYSLKEISVHKPITRENQEIIKKSDFAFVGGTNILTNNMLKTNRLVPEGQRKVSYLFTKMRNVILFGVGWSRYESIDPNIYTRVYLNKILNKNFFQSVRDSYSSKMLQKVYRGKVLNTSCPTTWRLDESFSNKYNPELKKILFTLTDYGKKNIDADEHLIKTILDQGLSEIYFFPQGKKDVDHINSLNIYRKNLDKITMLPNDYMTYKDFITNEKFNYIGTRLHGGIYALQKNNPTHIISIDNRAKEIASDINLPFSDRNDLSNLNMWLKNDLNIPNLSIPNDSINKWKAQFK